MVVNPILTQIGELEGKALYALNALDTITREGRVSKCTINSLSFIGIHLEGYSGIHPNKYYHEHEGLYLAPTVEGIGGYLIDVTKRILSGIWRLIKGLLTAIGSLFKWLKSKLNRNKLGLDKATLLKELAPSIEHAYRRTGINPAMFTAKIERTLQTPVINTLNKNNVIPLNRTYINLRDHYSTYFKESCLSRKDDKRTVLIFNHLDEWVQLVANTNSAFEQVCGRLNSNMSSDLHRVDLSRVIPTSGATLGSVDSFIRLGYTAGDISEDIRWKLFYSKAKEHHELISSLSKKDPEYIKSNRIMPTDILNGYVSLDTTKLGSNLAKLEMLYKRITASSLETLSIRDSSLLPDIIRVSGELKYIVLGTHHASASLNEFISAVDVLQQVKYSILEDMKNYLRVA